MLTNPSIFAEFTKWFAQNGQPYLLLGIILSIVWHTAVTYTQFKHLRANMVTKKDLELAKLNLIAELKHWADEKFVTERECATRIVGLGSGPKHER